MAFAANQLRYAAQHATAGASLLRARRVAASGLPRGALHALRATAQRRACSSCHAPPRALALRREAPAALRRVGWSDTARRMSSDAAKARTGEVGKAGEASTAPATPVQPPAPEAAGSGAGATPPPMSPPSQHVETGNFFFDNPGLFAALFIGSVVGYFYYNKRGGDARTAVIASIEEQAVVSPREIRQLREDNEITPDKFENLVKAALAEHTDGQPMTYADFNRLLLEHLFVDAADVVNWGHHLERVLKYLQQERDPERGGLDARVLLVAMSLGLKAKAPDRVAPLFTIFSKDGETMTINDFITCVGALQDTFQLPTDFQVQRTEKYPFPQYERMSAETLAAKAMEETNIVPDSADMDSAALTQEDFRKLLLSSALCTWGECFDKKKKKKKRKKKKKAEDEVPAEVATVLAAAQEAEEQAAAAADGLMEFMPAASFRGRVPGYAFKAGPKGVGYYPDKLEAYAARQSGELPPLPEPEPEPEPSAEEEAGDAGAGEKAN